MVPVEDEEEGFIVAVLDVDMGRVVTEVAAGMGAIGEPFFGASLENATAPKNSQ